MQFTISTPNLTGHIIEDRHAPGDEPMFDIIDSREALCGATVTKTIGRARYVCGRCVAVLIAERNSQNRLLDILERANDRANTMVSTLASLAFPDDDGDDGEDQTVVPGDPERGGADEPGTPDAPRPEDQS